MEPVISSTRKRTRLIYRVQRMAKAVLLAYAISAVGMLVLLSTFGLAPESIIAGATPLPAMIASLMLTSLVMYFMTKWYFLDPEITPSLREGAFVGLAIVLGGSLFDVAIILLTGTHELLAWYFNPGFIGVVLIIMGLTCYVGFMEARYRGPRS